MADSTETRAHALTGEGDVGRRSAGNQPGPEHAGQDKAGKHEAGRHVHHGRTAAAWAGSMLAMVAFILGGIAVMMQNWVLFGVAVVILLAAAVATKVLQVRGHGAL